MIIKLVNYRRFSSSNPAIFQISSGNTCFLGVNNSGKSSLLKFFIEFRSVFRTLSDSHKVVQLTRNPERIPIEGQVKDHHEIFHNQNNDDMKISFEDEVTVEIDHCIVHKNVVIEITVNRERLSYSVTSIKFDNTEIDKNTFSVPSNVNLYHNVPGRAETFDISSFLHFFQQLSKAIYIGPFRNIVNVGGREDYFDISIGEKFIGQWSAWKTGDDKQNQKAIINLEEEVKRIFEYSTLQINASNDGKTLSIVADSESYTLRELGAGLSQYIVVLANALTTKPTYILIDEPELNLHPALQLDFLTTLSAYASEGVVYATHTLGLAKSTADVIYLANKINAHESTLSEYNEMTTLSESLGELNYAGLKAVGIEKVLLVEGQTEIRAVQEILNKIGQKHKVILLSLGGGSNITAGRKNELKNFAEIAAQSFALIDSEKSSLEEGLTPQRLAFIEVCKELGITSHVLERRAFENYMSDRAIKETFPNHSYTALAPYQEKKSMPSSWGKSDNWKIIKNMTQDELSSTDLWKFLESVVKK